MPHDLRLFAFVVSIVVIAAAAFSAGRVYTRSGAAPAITSAATVLAVGGMIVFGTMWIWQLLHAATAHGGH